MRVRFWGVRGSVATPGADFLRYGGETSCVSVQAAGPGGAEHLLILDAGTGLRRLGAAIPPDVRAIDLVLSHLHLDHIVGLGFFGALFRPDLRITIWGPPSPSSSLLDRLGRYLSPPIFPVRLRDVAADLELRDMPEQPMRAGPFEIDADPIIHPDPAMGYRVSADGATLAYLPDHEPALGGPGFGEEPTWTSGFGVAQGADLVIHDAQYTASEYVERMGWGHTANVDAVRFAELAGARRLALFHHDPSHTDDQLDRIVAEARGWARAVDVFGAREGLELDLAG